MLKGAIFTKKHRDNLRLSHIGQVAWNKGLKKEKQSVKCEACPTMFIKRFKTSQFCSRSCSKKGNKNCVGIRREMTEETRLKVTESARKNAKRGALSHLWKGGITPLNKQLRQTPEYKDWRTSVFKRDDYTCQDCKGRGLTLQADHIKPFAYYPELRLVTENGRTLCIGCHRKTDTYAGRAKNKHEKYESR